MKRFLVALSELVHVQPSLLLKLIQTLVISLKTLENYRMYFTEQEGRTLLFHLQSPKMNSQNLSE